MPKGGGRGGGRGGGGRGKGGPIATDKYGAPLNWGPWKDGRLATKSSGGAGKGGGRGSKGGGRGASSGGRGGGKGSSSSGSSGGKGGGVGKGGGKGGGSSGGRGSGGRGGGSGFPPLPSKLDLAKAAVAKAANKPTPTPRDNSVAVGMARADELLVRKALNATRLDDNFFEEEDDDDEDAYAIGAPVYAVFEEEWYEATIVDYGDDWIVVYFEEYDYTGELPFDDEHVVPNHEAAAAVAAAAPSAKEPSPAASRPSEAPRAAKVPPKPAGNPFRAQREALPVYEHRKDLIHSIERNQVVIVEGETGCGKSTQVPQYVLEHAASTNQVCNVICTQPRRISALGVSERVAAERGESVGGTVGYSIRLESRSCNTTALLFCTTGILTRRLEVDGDLNGITHIFVDEVHERSMESDFLLMVIRDLLIRRSDLKLVLMSATLDADMFAAYFTRSDQGRRPRPPIHRVPGRTYPVTTLYLEDAIEVTGHRIRAGSD